MALQTTTTIKIGERIIKNFTKLKIIQKIHDHHTFSVEVRKDILVDEFKSSIPVATQLTSEKISIEIKAIPDLNDLMVITNPQDYKMQFYGVVSGINLRKSRVNDMEETIVITGYSTSIVLENGPESNSFSRMPIEDIVNKVKSGYEIEMDVIPFYKDNLAYTVQYNESDFKFLNRLAMRYGQWFYYNGRVMVFGSPGSSAGEPKLIYGVNMQDFSYDVKLAPTLFKIIENDNKIGEYSTDETLRYRKEVDGFHQNFINKSNALFNKQSVIQLNQNAVGSNGKSSAEEYTKNKMRSAMSGMLQIKASSEVPGITLGNTVEIRGVDMQLESRYTVTKITHTCDDGGGYENHFTAVNFNGSVFSPKTNPDLVPHCQSQTAVVIDNVDPDGLSGITVQMPWQKEKGERTPYIPMLQQHGGDGKGFHWIPEVGETVFVDFQGGNAEMPIVTGTLTSRKEKSGYSTPNNDLKVMRTRSGIIIIYNDADGSLLIEDPSGNKYFMDGKGSISLDAPKNMTFTAGESIYINAGQDMTTTVGMNKKDTIGGDHDEKITGSKTISIGVNFVLTVVGNMLEWIKGNKEVVGKDIKESAQEVFLNSTEKSINLKGAQDVNSHSGENSRNY